MRVCTWRSTDWKRLRESRARKLHNLLLGVLCDGKFDMFHLPMTCCCMQQYGAAPFQVLKASTCDTTTFVWRKFATARAQAAQTSLKLVRHGSVVDEVSTAWPLRAADALLLMDLVATPVTLVTGKQPIDWLHSPKIPKDIATEYHGAAGWKCWIQGYYLEGDSCLPNRCTCTNGKAVNGTGCGQDGAASLGNIGSKNLCLAVAANRLQVA